jgi:hypothetical protein
MLLRVILSLGRADWLAVTVIVTVNAVTAARPGLDAADRGPRGEKPLPLTESRIIVDSVNESEEYP